MILLNFATKIKGTSTVSAHTDWITIDAIQMGVGRAISTSGGGADRDTSNPSFSEISLSKATDIASADLFMEAVCGKSLGKAEIHFIQTGGPDKKQQVFLTIELEEAIISSYSVSSSGERPSESFSINFTKISYKYDSFSGDKITTGTAKKWDLEANAKI
ncbi:type VI secretion system tube protein Hcp [Pseudomonas gingeri]|uniref:Type VI secretion system tube protein Hcp n=1 Tax=Pseudomonas gingeri TaxID=117681 RepID=A0A7Y7YC44_9PSED|nr:type VI secretion system tube protein Hcp [Pseudomonas gingeri]NWA02531.1 type VI secretion system tube protein Hcp [Pseudomonas gingeri]NWA12296.1 type VI secretion system tube protein Hcp [Pseudomonas gingeri]NWA57298.1 type VI secretion system tube protein Hcp [Pseudomonas gingeri]NWA93641.1 type VI secretion system tube protein Hcp [Pseudomonas gingeri]NWB03113.1 type VI secretion system tube protein Hcp [Pseudomonas gingeri]